MNSPAPTPARRGFSLIEVVLALGIVSFGLLSVFAMLGVSLQAGKESISQQESFAVSQALNRYMQSQNFSTIYGWAKTASDQGKEDTIPKIYAYFYSATGAPPQVVVRDINDTKLASESAARKGNLFYVKLTCSRSVPVNKKLNYTSSDFGADVNAYPEAAVAFQSALYVVPTIDIPATTATTTDKFLAVNFPVLTYDIIVPRK